MKSIPFLPLALLATLTPACGDGGSGSPADAGAPDAASEPDAGCEPTAALPFAWRPIDEVSAGSITTDTAGGVTTAQIDATAGGTDAAADNPYIYIDLATGAKVEITDYEALSSTDWDIAIKRYVFLLNGGDSGPGGVEVAVIFNQTDLAAVTEPPADSEFYTDDWADEDCDLIAGPLEEPMTAMGNWYEYMVGQPMGVTPQPYIYVIRARDGAFWKLRILTYYGGPSMASGFYEIEWAPL